MRDILTEKLTDENFQSFAQQLLQEHLANVVRDTELPDRIADHVFSQLRRTMISVGEDPDWENARQFLNVDIRMVPNLSMWKMQTYSFTTFMSFGLLCYCLSKVAKKCNKSQ